MCRGVIGLRTGVRDVPEGVTECEKAEQVVEAQRHRHTHTDGGGLPRWKPPCAPPSVHARRPLSLTSRDSTKVIYPAGVNQAGEVKSSFNTAALSASSTAACKC